MCLFFHKWSKWKQYESKGYGSVVLQQQRYCLKCNKMQDKPVTDFWSDHYRSRLLHKPELGGLPKPFSKSKTVEKKYSSTYKKK